MLQTYEVLLYWAVFVCFNIKTLEELYMVELLMIRSNFCD